MNDLVQYRNTPALALVSLTAALAVGPINWPNPETPPYIVMQVVSSYSSFEKSLKFGPTSLKSNFTSQMADVYATLSRGQEPLGAEFEAIWDANVATLYES